MGGPLPPPIPDLFDQAESLVGSNKKGGHPPSLELAISDRP